eukprot:CAMPEP_0172518406 /NCGR_PEP_ID=MMETSP1066-20121228/290799_1 /TAXON_ID=671091 /ORGANISM="Coscinodiscus wailesii, Strain CCMP2513" /LENGTH=118 /DNA_ID=CAMNT_0013300793 /DNA_START=811 /DNA_END=1167 /DNA_ORIENTATION=-
MTLSKETALVNDVDDKTHGNDADISSARLFDGSRMKENTSNHHSIQKDRNDANKVSLLKSYTVPETQKNDTNHSGHDDVGQNNIQIINDSSSHASDDLASKILSLVSCVDANYLKNIQ